MTIECPPPAQCPPNPRRAGNAYLARMPAAPPILKAGGHSWRAIGRGLDWLTETRRGARGCAEALAKPHPETKALQVHGPTALRTCAPITLAAHVAVAFSRYGVQLCNRLVTCCGLARFSLIQGVSAFESSTRSSAYGGRARKCLDLLTAGEAS